MEKLVLERVVLLEVPNCTKEVTIKRLASRNNFGHFRSVDLLSAPSFFVKNEYASRKIHPSQRQADDYRTDRIMLKGGGWNRRLIGFFCEIATISPSLLGLLSSRLWVAYVVTTIVAVLYSTSIVK